MSSSLQSGGPDPRVSGATHYGAPRDGIQTARCVPLFPRRHFVPTHPAGRVIVAARWRACAWLYDVLLEDRFYSARAYFLVDKQGTLRWMHIEARLGDRRDDAELLRVIASL